VPYRPKLPFWRKKSRLGWEFARRDMNHDALTRDTVEWVGVQRGRPKSKVGLALILWAYPNVRR